MLSTVFGVSIDGGVTSVEYSIAGTVMMKMISSMNVRSISGVMSMFVLRRRRFM